VIEAGALDWGVFWAAIAAVLLSDALAARSGGRGADPKSALRWSAVWIGLGLAFGAWVALRFGADAGLTYLTAYALEKSLSVDNLFIFALIFAQTGIPPALQRRALFWGVAGALVMRALLIGAGVWLLGAFHWLIYVFGVLLVFAALRMLFGEERQRKLVEASCAVCTSWVGRVFPISPQLDGERFLTRREGRLAATPLLVALLLIEGADVVFAVDSIPAVFAVTTDPYLVYSSNVLALLGLRSLYFVLAGALRRLRFLRAGLAVMLLFVAAKMFAADVVHIPPGVSLAVIAMIFAAAILASRLFPETAGETEKPMPACSHLDQVKDVQPNTRGCEECLKSGDRWVHLRLCLSCGHVGCCDSSKNKHATRHFGATGHPVMQSLERGESWRWCYMDNKAV
jgi:tellurite resistance protein TerC